MSKFCYTVNSRRKLVDLPIGGFSPVVCTGYEVIENVSNLSQNQLEELAVIAAKNGPSKRFFFSSRAFTINPSGSQEKNPSYIEVKGAGKPEQGISTRDYFLEDGRDKDPIQDPIGGYSLEKALIEWEFMKELIASGIKTTTPLALLRLTEVKGPRGEGLALLTRTGESNIRLGYFENNPARIKTSLSRDYPAVLQNVLSNVGRSLKTMHKERKICHNALHEENITLNGELVDFEYSSKARDDLVYRDLWYCLLSFAEVFGTPMNISTFLKNYCGRERKGIIRSSEPKDIEVESKRVAESLV